MRPHPAPQELSATIAAAAAPWCLYTQDSPSCAVATSNRISTIPLHNHILDCGLRVDRVISLPACSGTAPPPPPPSSVRTAVTLCDITLGVGGGAYKRYRAPKRAPLDLTQASGPTAPASSQQYVECAERGAAGAGPNCRAGRGRGEAGLVRVTHPTVDSLTVRSHTP